MVGDFQPMLNRHISHISLTQNAVKGLNAKLWISDSPDRIDKSGLGKEP